MTEYQLYCFAQSGNAYRAALMLNLIGADRQPVFIDFFNGETRPPIARRSMKWAKRLCSSTPAASSANRR